MLSNRKMQVSIMYTFGVIAILSNALLLDATTIMIEHQLRGEININDKDTSSNMNTNENHHIQIPEPRTLQVSEVGMVVSWRLINATAGNKGQILIDPLLNNTVVDLSNYPGNQKFAIEAVTSNIVIGPIGSVRFEYMSKANFRTEDEAPYALCGNTLAEYKPCPNLVIVGTTTVAATPYSLPKGAGIRGTQNALTFRVTKTTAIPVASPTRTPSFAPTKRPTAAPNAVPSKAPTKTPSTAPNAVPSTAPTKTPSTAPIVQTNYLSAQWIEVQTNAPIDARHEACFVMVGRRAYLLAGRARKAVNIYDPITRTWTNGTAPPIQLHHTQCVAVNDSIWIVNPWTGGYPMERNTDKIYIYNTITDTWSTKAGLPEPRRRGGAASVLVGDKIYVSHGNRGGHETGNHAVTLGWLDYFDISEDRWYTNLPDAPHPRDHTGGGLVNGRICVAGGRDGGDVDFFAKVVLPTDCYDPITNAWSVEENIPSGRGGSSYGTTCDGRLMIAGGEGGIKTSTKEAWSNVDVFDGTSWITIDSLNIPRHGSGLAVDCICHQIHIASGARIQGGRYEITSVETLFANGVDAPCHLHSFP